MSCVSSEKAKKIYEKYNYRCGYCGFKIFTNVKKDSPFRATIDHITPKARGGNNENDNLIACCMVCNHAKDNMTETEFNNSLLIGKNIKENNKIKDTEIATLKSERYIIPYGKYIGVKGYSWNSQFFYKHKNQKPIIEKIDKIQDQMINKNKPDVIDEFFNKNNTENYTKAPSSIEKYKIFSKFNNRCAFCGCVIRSKNNMIGHVSATISLINPNKKYEPNNILASCAKCNSIKSTETLKEFRKDIFVLHDTSNIVTNTQNKNFKTIYETHYKEIVPKDKFYFEMSDTEKKEINDYWENYPQLDNDGNVIIEGKQTGEGTEILKDLLSNLKDEEKELTDKLNNIKERIEDIYKLARIFNIPI